MSTLSSPSSQKTRPLLNKQLLFIVLIAVGLIKFSFYIEQWDNLELWQIYSRYIHPNSWPDWISNILWVVVAGLSLEWIARFYVARKATIQTSLPYFAIRIATISAIICLTDCYINNVGVEKAFYNLSYKYPMQLSQHWYDSVLISAKDGVIHRDAILPVHALLPFVLLGVYCRKTLKLSHKEKGKHGV